MRIITSGIGKTSKILKSFTLGTLKELPFQRADRFPMLLNVLETYSMLLFSSFKPRIPAKVTA